MPDNVTLSAGALYGFLLVLARVGGSLVFVPLPGVRSTPAMAVSIFDLIETLPVAVERISGGRAPEWNYDAQRNLQLAAAMAPALREYLAGHAG